MKTGSVAKRFGLDPNTIADWTDQFKEFFSDQAISSNKKQRDYQPEDVVVINTIRGFRARNTTWEEIHVQLKSGERDPNLSPEFMSIDGENAITIYAEMREMRLKLDTAEAEIERLREVAEAERQRADEQIQLAQQRANEQLLIERKALQAERSQLNEDAQALQARINEQIRFEREANQNKLEQLIVEKTEWRMRYDMLKKRLGEDDDE